MKRTYMRWCCVVSCALLLGWSSPVWSDEPQPDSTAYAEGNEESQYQNAAQAQHDADLAEAYNEKLEAEMVSIQVQLEDEKNPAIIDELNAQYDELASQRLDEDVENFAEMRANGMGWGEIAHELGVHPSVLGLGHTKIKGMKSGDTELAMATTMDMKTGNSMGHGKAYDDGAGTSKNGNGNGKTQGSQKNKSDEKGNKGGNGNGNGGNGGNGNGNGKNK
ncbi:hypothetical protein [Desulfopila aestuarii]|uniref:Uncharacterized protein n=1 Tax=Desulfopila aestuarii DSM 18488 TaxID=1121416 RepID=A0A1M7XW82_9BACT|nr:hypothetical protein [Desulfopila aestuarii]SHO42766.1 hypothetical protein SAMN02745220_00142 [Desulfopila aestuarii DSM 18488]